MADHGAYKTILGIHPGALGDVVLFGQLLAGLRESRGGRVRLVAGGEKGRLLAGLGAADEALDFEALPMGEVFSATPPAGRDLPAALGRCDLLVSCLAAGDPQAQRRLAALASARRCLFLPVRPPGGYPRHLVDLWAEMAELEPVRPPRWSVPPAWRRRAGQARQAAGVDAAAGCLLVHPGSGGAGKCWPLPRFVELARRFARDSGLVPVFVLGPAELEWWGRGVVDSLRAEFATVVAPPLEVLAGLAADAQVYVGNDSGPTHLAAAVGAPTVALFAPTRPEHFSPRGRRVTVLAAREPTDIRLRDVLAALVVLQH